ncbi:MAG: tetratricopeptide repeat protein [Bacteroidales bacterium]|nr:tetratricopeptide repeat protein [Bacteroidales bacterium]
MKKFFLFTLMLIAFQLSAQNKEADNALKAYEKAKTDVAGKKAQDAASWVKLGKSIISIFDYPSRNLLTGLSPIEVRVVLKDQRSTGSSKATIDGEEYEVVHYADKDLYYDADGSLAFWVVTKPLLPQDLLSEAYDAFHKGFGFDAKGSQKKDLLEGFSNLQRRYLSDAMTANSMGDYSLSSRNFGDAVRCFEHPALNSVDTVILFYTGLTAFYAQEYERATEYIKRAVDMGYLHEGVAYSILAESYKALDQVDKAEFVLAEGFTKYPSNQGILVSLINLFNENDEDPSKVMEYIRKAQENEPNNESLFYAEGNAWRKLNNNEKALECFHKSVEINPNYMYGYLNIGSMYYDTVVDIQNRAADELDDRKWAAMMEESDQILMKAVDPFEKAFALTNDKDVQAEIAIYLKNSYYRLQGKDEAYLPLYEKYKAISEGQ